HTGFTRYFLCVAIQAIAYADVTRDAHPLPQEGVDAKHRGDAVPKRKPSPSLPLRSERGRCADSRPSVTAHPKCDGNNNTYAIVPTPPMYGRSTSGTMIEPSAFWQFSITAIRQRPTARPEPLSVCTNSGLPVAGLRQRACMRRAWKSVQLEHDEISRYVRCDGNQTSRS